MTSLYADIMPSENGKLANMLVIRNKLKDIFDYRKKEIEKRYGVYK